MRISKEPEERKQEILETAMKLFAQNGFEKTSISDIAREIGVAQGLCYRYFPSKDVLFQTALDEYANMLISKMTKERHKTASAEFLSGEISSQNYTPALPPAYLRHKDV